ncbi:MAG: HAMP domain-containing histidine kinase [Propionicimonas sp.]|nr:HAMP domain-containing histidine kinase [Propionicimonas sp.]
MAGTAASRPIVSKVATNSAVMPPMDLPFLWSRGHAQLAPPPAEMLAVVRLPSGVDKGVFIVVRADSGRPTGARASRVGNMFESVVRRLRGSVAASGSEFRDQLITAAAMVTAPVGWASAVINAVLGSPAWTVVLNAVAGFAVLGFWLYARATGRYRFAYLLAITSLFGVLFPAMFFASGGFASGVPVFFMFAIAFSAIILDGVALRVLVPLEALVFTATMLVAYYFPQLVTPPASVFSGVMDIVYSVLATGLAMVVALRLFIGIYERNKTQLTERNDELARVDSVKTDFLAMVAHELKNPLTVIGAHAAESARRLAATPDADQSEASNLAVIEAETDRLGRLVSQLLDLGRIKDGKLELSLAEHNLDTIIQQSLQVYRPLWSQYGNTIRVPRGSAAPLVMVDRERVVQVLINLLSNAARYTRDGLITVGVTVVGDFAELQVSDTGAGIEPGLLEHLGERPVRGLGEGVHSARDAGLGVGLMITKHIVTSHGGELHLQSQVGVGTTVRCTFPLAGPAPTD